MTNEQVSDWNVSALICLTTKSSWVGVCLRVSDSPEAEVRASEEILLLLGLLLWSFRLRVVSGSGLALLWLILIFVLEVGFRLWEAISHTWWRSSAGWPSSPPLSRFPKKIDFPLHHYNALSRFSKKNWLSSSPLQCIVKVFNKSLIFSYVSLASFSSNTDTWYYFSTLSLFNRNTR